MLNERVIETAIDLLQTRYSKVNHLYIRKIAKTIAKIGELNASAVNMLSVMADMREDVTEIVAELARATHETERDVLALLSYAEQTVYADDRFRRILSKQPLSSTAKARIRQYAASVATQTAQTMQNLSQTTAVSTPYQEAVDTAVLAVSTGVTDYNSAVRDVVRELGFNGLQVQYASGYHRRLDTAVRQNVLDATKQIAQKTADMVGEELGYDAVEISAHLHSAPDHAPVQGKVFLKSEFDKMQAGLPFTGLDGTPYAGFKRPLMQWNCMHIEFPFDTKRSVRTYSDQQLAKWEADNNAGCVVGGKHMTIYAASQLMRQLETKVRRWKDTAVAAEAAGDKTLQQQCQQRINQLSTLYNEVCKASGLKSRRGRMAVEGFTPYKTR